MKQCVRAEIVVPYMAIHGDIWRYVAIYGHISRYMAIHGNTLPHVATHRMSKSCHMKTTLLFESFFLFRLFKSLILFLVPNFFNFF